MCYLITYGKNKGKQKLNHVRALLDYPTLPDKFHRLDFYCQMEQNLCLTQKTKKSILVQQYLKQCNLELCNPQQYALLNCVRNSLRYVILDNIFEAEHFKVSHFLYFSLKLCTFLRYALFSCSCALLMFNIITNLKQCKLEQCNIFCDNPTASNKHTDSDILLHTNFCPVHDDRDMDSFHLCLFNFYSIMTTLVRTTC